MDDTISVSGVLCFEGLSRYGPVAQDCWLPDGWDDLGIRMGAGGKGALNHPNVYKVLAYL